MSLTVNVADLAANESISLILGDSDELMKRIRQSVASRIFESLLATSFWLSITSPARVASRAAPNGSGPSRHIANSFLEVDAGHSINFPKLYRYTAFT